MNLLVAATLLLYLISLIKLHIDYQYNYLHNTKHYFQQLREHLKNQTFHKKCE